MPESIDTIVIGGGQAGMAMSYHLGRRGRPHVVLERSDGPASVWRNRRWDSFTLVTPNWTVRLPGAEYDGSDPGGFLSRSEVVRYLEAYAQRYGLPIRYGVEATKVAPRVGGGFDVATSGGDFAAARVVVATGLFQSPRTPRSAAELPGTLAQLHSSQYRNPAELPPGAVLVVGSGQSGSQIAQDLHEGGRRVYLSVGGAGRLRRRYRGRDAMDWLYDIGFFDKTVDKLESPEERFSGNPHVSGRDGGREIDLHRFARDGIVLLGRFDGADADTLRFAGDLHERLREIDEFDDKVRGAIDELIAEQGIQAPADDEPRLRDGYAAPILRALDARAADVNSVVWATGYRFDFSLVDAPIFDAHGYPLQQRGVTSVEGLYFVGLPWLWKQKSGLFLGVGEDAAHIADHIAARAST